MAYEVFKRTAVRVEQPSLSLVPDGRIAFNAAAVRVLTGAGVKSVLLLWDRTSRKVALKAAAKGEKDCYAVSIVKGTYSGSLRAKSFLSHIGWSAPKRTMLPATWNEKEKMFEISLPPEYVGSESSPGSKRKPKPAS